MTSSKLIDIALNVDDDFEQLVKIREKKKIRLINIMFSSAGIITLLSIIFLIHLQIETNNYYETTLLPSHKTTRTLARNNSTPSETTQFYPTDRPPHSEGSRTTRSNRSHKQPFIDVDDNHIIVKNWNGSINVVPNEEGYLPNVISFKNIDGSIHIG